MKSKFGIRLLFLGLLIETAFAVSGWSDSGDVRWALNCDFTGNDLTSKGGPGESCGGFCSENDQCTHFTWTNWNGGTCWMKRGGGVSEGGAIDKRDDNAVCGFIKSRNGASSGGGGGGINFQSGSGGVRWSLNCDWPGNDIGNTKVQGEQCGDSCISKRNEGCTHFTWTDYEGGTCWMKGRQQVSESQAVAASSGVCGYLPSSGPGPQPVDPSVQGLHLSVVNKCSYTVWMATTPNSNKQPLPDGTVTLATGASHVYRIPNEGWAGRFWPKFGCDPSGRNCAFGESSPPCPDGGCHPPADTKVEFFIPPQPPRSDAWYDVSLVDGYSIPMKIAPKTQERGTCITTTCSLSLDSCPSNEKDGLGDLRVFRQGRVVACLSPCKRWNFPAPFGLNKPETQAPGLNMCCPTPPISPEQCSKGPVVSTQYVNVVRRQCPTAYSYAYDDEAALHNCPGDTSFGITLCP